MKILDLTLFKFSDFNLYKICFEFNVEYISHDCKEKSDFQKKSFYYFRLFLLNLNFIPEELIFFFFFFFSQKL